jgi:hypothetical protein
MTVCYSNHLIRQEKVRFILHLSFYVGSVMTRKSRIQDKHPGSATLVERLYKINFCSATLY